MDKQVSEDLLGSCLAATDRVLPCLRHTFCASRLEDLKRLPCCVRRTKRGTMGQCNRCYSTGCDTQTSLRFRRTQLRQACRSEFICLRTDHASFDQPFCNSKKLHSGKYAPETEQRHRRFGLCVSISAHAQKKNRMVRSNHAV